MAPHVPTELYRRVSSLRDEAFELVEQMQRFGYADESASILTDAAGDMQSVANRLGAVEQLVVTCASAA